MTDLISHIQTYLAWGVLCEEGEQLFPANKSALALCPCCHVHPGSLVTLVHNDQKKLPNIERPTSFLLISAAFLSSSRLSL